MNEQLEKLLKEAKEKESVAKNKHLSSLGIYDDISDKEYAELCKFYPPNINYTKEKFLTYFTLITAIILIIGGVNLIINNVDNALLIIFAAIFTFAFALVIVEISKTLKRQLRQRN